MSRARVMAGGIAERAALATGPNGRALCRWCSLEVPKGRQTFCSDWCVHEWRLRTDPGYLRDKVFERDHGVCAECAVDCVAEWNRIRRLPHGRRLVVLKTWGIKQRGRKSLWDADHILPVCEGGGECDLDNLRTLCVRCHLKVTAELRARRMTKAEGPSTS